MPVAFGSDGRTLYVRRGDVPLQVFKLDLQTGRSDLWKEFLPSDTAGLVGLFGVHISADGSSYVYAYGRQLASLYAVEGLK
jgi:hypothetical protein